ncbi:MAG TPA: site-specific integrase [Candidatus Acidoferrales bacterium]|nr:site-specific integrase [Candidatus Acidoferrales bacterium]
MAIWKRGRTWWTQVWVNGVRHAKSTHTSRVREAREIDRQFKEELLLAQYHAHRLQPEMPFDELAARFLAEAEPKPHHMDRLKILLPYFRDTPIGEIHRGDVREYRKDRHKRKTITETTVNRDLEVLRHLLFWAVEEGYLGTNPLSRMPMATERRKPRAVMTLEEEEKLLASAAPHLCVIIVAALDTGMRRGELLTERWEHVDFTRRLLSVTRSKTAGGEGREIPLTSRLYETLAARRKPDGLVFQFRHQAIHAVKTAWKAAIRRAGIRYYRFHDLRHTFNTRLMEAGVMQEVRKALMGHSSGEDVHSIYTHVELPMKRDAIRKLEEWVALQKALAEKEREFIGNTKSDQRHNAGDDLPARPHRE